MRTYLSHLPEKVSQLGIFLHVILNSSWKIFLSCFFLVSVVWTLCCIMCPCVHGVCARVCEYIHMTYKSVTSDVMTIRFSPTAFHTCIHDCIMLMLLICSSQPKQPGVTFNEVSRPHLIREKSLNTKHQMFYIITTLRRIIFYQERLTLSAVR